MFSFFKKKKQAPVFYSRIKHTAFLEILDSIPDMPAEQKPLNESIVGDLIHAYAIDLGDSYTFVTPTVLAEHNMGEEDVRNQAMMNSMMTLQNMTTRTTGGVYELASDNNVACSILFPELWQQIEQEIGAKPLVSFPHRDVVFYTRTADKDGIEELKQAITSVDFSDTHALSRLIYQHSSEGWTVVDA